MKNQTERSDEKRKARKLERKSIVKIALVASYLLLMAKVVGQEFLELYQEPTTQMDYGAVATMGFFFVLIYTTMTPIVTWKEE